MTTLETLHLANPAPSRPKPGPARRHAHKPRLSVVIVNYCQWEATAQLVRQLRSSACVRSGEAEVMIVDNHSPPHPLVSRLRRQSGVSLRRWGRNRGYARAVNEGCRLSRGSWFLLLNPDVSVAENFLDEMLLLADRLTAENSRAGIVGCHLLNRDGSPQLSCGRFPTLLGTLAGLALPRARRKYHPVPGRKRCQVPWVTGCCLLMQRACLEQVNGFDEDYFLYYEDVDFCRRARALGWSVWYEPGVSVVHHFPLHQREVPPRLRLCTRHALLTYCARHWPSWQFRLMATLVKVESWVRRQLAVWRGDTDAMNRFTELGELVTDLEKRRPAQALRRLHRVMNRLPEKSPATRAVAATIQTSSCAV